MTASHEMVKSLRLLSSLPSLLTLIPHSACPLRGLKLQKLISPHRPTHLLGFSISKNGTTIQPGARARNSIVLAISLCFTFYTQYIANTGQCLLLKTNTQATNAPTPLCLAVITSVQVASVSPGDTVNSPLTAPPTFTTGFHTQPTIFSKGRPDHTTSLQWCPTAFRTNAKPLVKAYWTCMVLVTSYTSHTKAPFHRASLSS